jgi:hypothetical protein
MPLISTVDLNGLIVSQHAMETIPPAVDPLELVLHSNPIGCGLLRGERRVNGEAWIEFRARFRAAGEVDSQACGINSERNHLSGVGVTTAVDTGEGTGVGLGGEAVSTGCRVATSTAVAVRVGASPVPADESSLGWDPAVAATADGASSEPLAGIAAATVGWSVPLMEVLLGTKVGDCSPPTLCCVISRAR